MNILNVVPWYKPNTGGVVNAVDRMCQELISRGHQATVLIDSESDRLERLPDVDTVPVYATRMRYFYWYKAPLKSFIAFLAYLFPTLFRLRRMVKDNNIDIVVVHFPGPWALHFLFLRMLFSIPYVVCIHGSDIHQNLLEHWSTRLGLGVVMRRADCLVSCSEDLLYIALRLLGSKPRRSRVIYYGLSHTWGNQSREVASSQQYIISQGLPLDVKGGDVTIKAFATISSDYPSVRLRIIGPGDQEELRKLIDKLNLGTQVDLIGLVPSNDIPVLFQQSLFGVIASRREGLPLAAMELQYMGRPVIATSVGGLPEFIDHDVTGFLVPAGNYDSLASKMKVLLDDEPLRMRMGEAGRLKVCNEFQITRTVDTFLELFGQIVGQPAVDRKRTGSGAPAHEPSRTYAA
ncbi:MAG: glycosyltransferase family 4 protein [Candidatus Zixiibacteriota bacterium]